MFIYLSDLSKNYSIEDQAYIAFRSMVILDQIQVLMVFLDYF